jgi:D-alanyl-D-alanine carboxypeptidase/D-alanyl-D-alanine-endopeptidase (penicillin-binding protein 4)
VVLEPASSAIPIVNDVRTVPGSTRARVAIQSRSDGAIEAHGWIGGRAQRRTYEIDMEDPALFTAGAFRDALRAQGITVDGAVRLARAPATAIPVTALTSPPLARLIAAMDRESINHYAELLFRDAVRGPDRLETGSASLGAQLLQHVLAVHAGVAPDALTVTDGSGLSTLDRITPGATVAVLAYADAAPWGPAFHAALPVAGESELLRNRMRQTAAQGNLHAKTGTTNDVIGLGGYVTALNGEVLAFSFLYNGHDRWNAKSTIDAMGETLAEFVRE